MRYSPAMPELQPVQGELQTQVMALLWRLERATVEDVRRALPPRHRGAYTTIQTTLQRLYERGLLTRAKQRHAFVYAPALSEAEYVSLSIEQAIAGASREARHTALAQLIGGLREDDLDDVQRRARAIERSRRKR
jgi:predicted transcriptional regulator